MEYDGVHVVFSGSWEHKMFLTDDVLDTVIRHREARADGISTKGFRHISEVQYDDLTFRVRNHFSSIDLLEYFDEEVMDLGQNILQSPIERAVFAFLKIENYDLDLNQDRIFTVLPGDSIPDTLYENIGVAICPQYQVERYYLDLGVFINSGECILRFDFECDGVEFHEKDNRQTRHDYERDIVISNKQFNIFRVRGAEINRNPLWEVEKFAIEVKRWIAQQA